MEKNKNVVLDTDICFTNKLAFLGTFGQVIEFGTIQHIMNRKKATILNALYMVISMYEVRGFKIVSINADNEFECLREDLMAIGITLNVASAHEHVPRIERRFRVIKERSKAIRHSLLQKSW